MMMTMMKIYIAMIMMMIIHIAMRMIYIAMIMMMMSMTTCCLGESKYNNERAALRG